MIAASLRLISWIASATPTSRAGEQLGDRWPHEQRATHDGGNDIPDVLLHKLYDGSVQLHSPSVHARPLRLLGVLQQWPQVVEPVLDAPPEYQQHRVALLGIRRHGQVPLPLC